VDKRLARFDQHDIGDAVERSCEHRPGIAAADDDDAFHGRFDVMSLTNASADRVIDLGEQRTTVIAA
jgi:hypothetical protein